MYRPEQNFRPLIFLIAVALLLISRPSDVSAEVTTGDRVHRDIAYRDDSASAAEVCRLDVSVPQRKPEGKGYATVVWLHGGGLTGGSRHVPEQLETSDFGVVAVDYRLVPTVPVELCIDDSAAAVAWTIANIEQYGGDPKKVIVSGHSAGGYLTLMLGLDSHYLQKYGVQTDQLAGLAPLSGHTITHFTQRASMGLSDTDVVVDSMAPLRHIRKTAPPILLVTGDRELEMLGRYEENAYLARMLQVVGHTDVELREIDDADHGGMVEPAMPLLIDFVHRVSADKN